VWVDSEKRLTKSNETSDMKNGIQRKMMKLHAVDKEKPVKKLMGRERKAMEKEGKEHNPISFWRRGNALVTEEDDWRRFREKAILFCFLQIGLLKHRRNPLESHLVATLLHHCCSVRNLLDGHARIKRSGAARRKKAQGGRSSGGGRGIANW
jgi:hypothetical protein